MRLGIKVHWRDIDVMVGIADKHGATVLEYQMLPGDLENNAERAIEAFLPYRGRFELRVHQPEAYLADGRPRFLDVSAPDAAERARSSQVLGEVARHAMELRAKGLIVHPGGVWRPGEVGGSVELLREGLVDVPRHVPFFLENMQSTYALGSVGLPDGFSPAAFRMPLGLLAVEDLVDGYTFDISHAFLCTEKGSVEMIHEFVRQLAPRVKHVHANGSRGGMGQKGEGTPFDDSDYGDDVVRAVLDAMPRDAVIVPEIMDGHKHGGAKFDAALAHLRRLTAAP